MAQHIADLRRGQVVGDASRRWVHLNILDAPPQRVTLSGDVTGSGAGTVPTSLASVNATPGTFTNANITVNAKGLVTAAANGSAGTGGGGGTVTSVTAGTGLTGGTITLSGTIALSVPVSVADGGTGAATAPAALTSLGAVPLAGGVMTGLLTLSGPPTASLGAASKAYVDSAPNQTITLSGDVTGSGTAGITATLAASGVAAGAYNNVTVNAKGLVTAGTNLAYLTGNQTITLSGDITGSGATAIAGTVTALQGHAVSATAPAANQVLEWSGSAWTPTTLAAGGSVTSITAGNGLTGGTITTSGTIGLATPVAVANGGTGGTTQATAATALSVVPRAGRATSYHGDNASFAGNPPGTPIMAGAGATSSFTITPQITGTVLIFITGNLSSAAAQGQTQVTLQFGSGTPPAQGALQAGTSLGLPVSGVSAGVGYPLPFCLVGVQTGLAIGTTYWFDIAYGTLTVGANALISGLTGTAVEI